MADRTGARQRRFKIETMRGEPIRVRGHRLTPVARVVSFGRARGTIGRDRVSGWGGGFFRVTPLALIEHTPRGERRIAVSNGTAVAGLVAAATAVTVFGTVLRWLLRRSRKRGLPLFPG